MKKKKKKKVVKEEDEFAKKLEALNIEGNEGEEPVVVDEQDGDMEKGTGIWQHDENKAVTYNKLLSRFFVSLAQKNPDHASSGTRSYKITLVSNHHTKN